MLKNVMRNAQRVTLALMLMAPVSAMAQEPGIAETITYIKERCEIPNFHKLMQRIEISNSGLFSITTDNFTRDGEKRWVQHRFVNLKQVEFSSAGDGGTIYYSCGMAKCVSEETEPYYRDRGAGPWIPKPSYGQKWDGQTLECNARDATLNAFKHLQKLLGGAKILRDPFVD